MRLQLKTGSFERIAFEGDRARGNEFYEPAIGLSYRPTTPVRADVVSLASPIAFDGFNVELKAVAEHAYAHCPRFSSGIVSCEGWSLSGPNGSLFSAPHGVMLHGHRFGEGMPDYLKWHTQSAFGATWSDDQFVMDVDCPGETIKSAWAIGGPGIDIYGHWLLDVVPRLHLMIHSGEFLESDRPVLSPPLPKWAPYFFGAAGIPQSRLRIVEPKKVVTGETILSPTFPKIGYVLDLAVCAAAWSALAKSAPRSNREFGHKKIWLSRSRWPVQRSIKNIQSLEALLEARGFVVVHPQDLSLDEQASLFSDARVILSQDGSALHNVIFCKPGATVGVIGLRERRNLWHIGICEALGHRIGYIECDSDNSANLETVDLMIEALLHQADP